MSIHVCEKIHQPVFYKKLQSVAGMGSNTIDSIQIQILSNIQVQITNTVSRNLFELQMQILRKVF